MFIFVNFESISGRFEPRETERERERESLIRVVYALVRRKKDKPSWIYSTLKVEEAREESYFFYLGAGRGGETVRARLSYRRGDGGSPW
mgnify:CR=1 FL=1